MSKLKEEDVLENIPDYLLDKLKLCTRFQAIHWIHFPKNIAEKTLAINRLKFEELFFLQMRLLLGKENRKRKLKGAVFDKVGSYFNTFYTVGLADSHLV